MSLSKLTASALSGTQETTVALAALNFDFALFKTEAPKEYQALGSALSPYRREVAEDGDIHATARKLRALFEHVLPPVPSLYNAYGIRASEIASSSLKNQRVTGGSGAFAAYQGIDGGSIWAAATSGTGAVAIHLLACMLAKIWSSSEATSIWEEIVVRRKEQLSAVDGSDPQNVFAAWAARSTLTRQQLANWDASARAWLRAGDDATQFRQRQLKLILENIDIPVNTKSDVYDSVISAWTSAMIVLNKLVEGMPYSIENSSILLALSAWHLFPDMSVLSTSNHFIKQEDPLVDPRGILTLGLQSAQSAAVMQHQSGRKTPDRGITWSLPLAYYRFYGDPVRKENALNTDGSRISITQLQIIALGCIFHGWRETGFNVEKAAQLLSDLWNFCTHEKYASEKRRHPRPSNKSWFASLANAAETYLTSGKLAQKEYARLFNYGRRRCPEFLGVTQKSPSSIVALQKPQTLLGLVLGHQGRIRLLREKANQLDCDPRSLIIHYALPAYKTGETVFAITTVVPIKDKVSESVGYHKRWIIDDSARARSISQREEESGGEPYKTLGRGELLGPIHSVRRGDRMFWSNSPVEFSHQKMVTSSVDDIFGDFAEMALFRGKVEKGKPRVLTGVPFEFVFGDPAIAAIYRILEEEKPATQIFCAEDIRNATAQASVNISRSGLIKQLGEVPTDSQVKLTLGRHMRSLKILCTIVDLYKQLSDATIAMTLTSTELYNIKWMPDTDLIDSKPGESTSVPSAVIQAFEPLQLDLASSFACIAMLESGKIDLAGTGLQSIMAMSAGDSLYIATPLLCDPAYEPDTRITRIRGNIGRAGIALLIPPDEPRTREIDPGDWNLINHDQFDGVIADSFKSTSLHMSFTDFVLPIDTGLHGGRDLEIYFLETVISVHDKGRWIGDLKILPIFQDPLFRRITTTGEKCACRQIQRVDVSSLFEEELMSVDSWYEFFDRPEGPVVVRAHGNWMARLAAASMSVVEGHLTLIFGDEICWRCGEIEHRHFAHKKKPMFLL